MYNPELMTAIYWSIQTVYISRKHGFWLLPNKNPNYMLEKFVMVLSSLDIHGSKVFSNNHFKSLAMKRWLCSLVGGLPWRFDFALVTLTEANSHLSVILVHFLAIFSLHTSHLRALFPLFHFFTFKNGHLSLFTLVTRNMVSPHNRGNKTYELLYYCLVDNIEQRYVMYILRGQTRLPIISISLCHLY